MIKTCIDCDSTELDDVVSEQEIPYLNKGVKKVVKAPIPHWRCRKCGAEFTDYRGERARFHAVAEACATTDPLSWPDEECVTTYGLPTPSAGRPGQEPKP